MDLQGGKRGTALPYDCRNGHGNHACTATGATNGNFIVIKPDDQSGFSADGAEAQCRS